MKQTPAQIRHDGWTPVRQRAFLDALADLGSVRAAARHVGMSVQSAYRLRNARGGEVFRDSWDAAVEAAFHALTDVAMDRALNGVTVPHYYKGELIAEHKVYSERLLLALLRQRAIPMSAPMSAHQHLHFVRRNDQREQAVMLADRICIAADPVVTEVTTDDNRDAGCDLPSASA